MRRTVAKILALVLLAGGLTGCSAFAELMSQDFSPERMERARQRQRDRDQRRVTRKYLYGDD